jgi:hypothetical protein
VREMLACHARDSTISILSAISAENASSSSHWENGANPADVTLRHKTDRNSHY